jgi:hypothetical protein
MQYDSIAGVAQLVELQPSKLIVASSNLVSRSSSLFFDMLLVGNCCSEVCAHVAQLVERFLGKEEVHRFNPGRGLHIWCRINESLLVYV